MYKLIKKKKSSILKILQMTIKKDGKELLLKNK